MLKKIGYKTTLTDDYDLISKSKIIIFPGVGNFDHVMNYVYEKKNRQSYLQFFRKSLKITWHLCWNAGTFF